MTKASTFFTPEERERIAAAVREAETRTSGEIVPMVVDQSYDYPRAGMVGAFFFSLATSLLICWWLAISSLWVFLPIFLVGYLVFHLLIRWLPGLRRALLPADEVTAEVEEMAKIAFLDQGLHRTRDETGILILVSLLEHRVQVLADRGINNRVPPDTWDEIVALVTAGIRQRKTCDALCQAVRRCGDLLQEHFPPRKDDRNELSNLIT